MSAIRSKGNKSTEIKLRMALVRARISGWQSHHRSVIGRPDFYFPQVPVAVFVDGCFWHGCSRCGHTPNTRSAYWAAKFLRNRTRDRVVNRSLRRQGIKVIRIWEHELKTAKGLERVTTKVRLLVT
jgi:DNA mismatch endonuclease (patch repair protein)